MLPLFRPIRFSLLAVFAALLLAGCVSWPSADGSQPTPIAISDSPVPSAASPSVSMGMPSPAAPVSTPPAPGATVSPSPSIIPVSTPTPIPIANRSGPKCYSSTDCYANGSRCLSRIEPLADSSALASGEECSCFVGKCVGTVPSVSTPTPTPSAHEGPLRFLKLNLSGIRTNRADLYWSTSMNTTAQIDYGPEQFVRTDHLPVTYADFDHFQQIDRLEPNRTYYLDVSACAQASCIGPYTLNFTTPAFDDFHWPGSVSNYTLPPGGR